jgi:hypothetical protein
VGLKETLPLLPSSTTWAPPKFLVTELPSRGGIVKRLNAPTGLVTKLTPVRAKAGDVNKLQALKFGDLLKAGMKPSAAARKLHTTVEKLMSKEETQAEVKRIVEKYHLEAKARALIQRALVNKGMLENSMVDGDPKLLLEYLKLAASDKETGINDPGQINVNLGPVMEPALKAMLDATIPVPAIECETEPVAGERQ